MRRRWWAALLCLSTGAWAQSGSLSPLTHPQLAWVLDGNYQSMSFYNPRMNSGDLWVWPLNSKLHRSQLRLLPVPVMQRLDQGTSASWLLHSQTEFTLRPFDWGTPPVAQDPRPPSPQAQPAPRAANAQTLAHALHPETLHTPASAGIKVLARFRLGAYEVVQVHSPQASRVLDWLRGADYPLARLNAATLQPFLSAGQNLVFAKYEGAPEGAMQALQITASDATLPARLPLALLASASAREQPITSYLLQRRHAANSPDARLLRPDSGYYLPPQAQHQFDAIYAAQLRQQARLNRHSPALFVEFIGQSQRTTHGPELLALGVPWLAEQPTARITRWRWQPGLALSPVLRITPSAELSGWATQFPLLGDFSAQLQATIAPWRSRQCVPLCHQRVQAIRQAPGQSWVSVPDAVKRSEHDLLAECTRLCLREQTRALAEPARHQAQQQAARARLQKLLAETAGPVPRSN